jgi:hypothetical protein
LRGLRFDFSASDSGFAAPPSAADAADAADTAGTPMNVSYSPGPASIAWSDAANSVSSRLPISSIIPPRPKRARRPVML